MKKLKTILITLLSLCCLTACSASNQSLDGTYSYEKDGSSMTITIDGRDGSLSIKAGDGSGLLFGKNSISTDFTIDKKKKKFKLEGEELNYSLSGNTLTVSGDGFGTIKLKKE
ncbi:hypothetical protein [Streptococcus anginosus]|uniref:Lipoprotein n=1 Tax=Streptococcus anginosus TaxID=1328 RepID=A0A3S4P5B7_STRAP|nr:hypothetical protein [Streptococcus anginosus]GAD41310.1 hypothetical protein ANG3_1773 [Streptococcus intermedius SK54 = ATCC 27335]EGL45785.1 hypothetical protein HMPREF9966_0017 [Streptococcus anginosus SK52 = DSM 20563]MBZ2158167.1 hypothetical protein [Streptococcus anginosus]ORE81950.1 hypothetical protein B6C93_07410 [Streptococcus anginosus SK52 = DSM 20563]UEB01519.1 hypothetical protein LK450_06035 [Streptococcus anginosus subsp. anginosus]